jgi:hypothetical protein
VLIFDPRELTLHTDAEAHRLTDEEVAGAHQDSGPGAPGFGGALAASRSGSALARRVHAFDAFDRRAHRPRSAQPGQCLPERKKAWPWL